MNSCITVVSNDENTTKTDDNHKRGKPEKA